jgi:hypothetical protein
MCRIASRRAEEFNHMLQTVAMGSSGGEMVNAAGKIGQNVFSCRSPWVYD